MDAMARQGTAASSSQLGQTLGARDRLHAFRGPFEMHAHTSPSLPALPQSNHEQGSLANDARDVDPSARSNELLLCVGELSTLFCKQQTRFNAGSGQAAAKRCLAPCPRTTAARWPSSAAMVRALKPMTFCASMSAPACMHSRTAATHSAQRRRTCGTAMPHSPLYSHLQQQRHKLRIARLGRDVQGRGRNAPFIHCCVRPSLQQQAHNRRGAATAAMQDAGQRRPVANGPRRDVCMWTGKAFHMAAGGAAALRFAANSWPSCLPKMCETACSPAPDARSAAACCRMPANWAASSCARAQGSRQEGNDRVSAAGDKGGLWAPLRDATTNSADRTSWLSPATSSSPAPVAPLARLQAWHAGIRHARIQLRCIYGLVWVSAGLQQLTDTSGIAGLARGEQGWQPQRRGSLHSSPGGGKCRGHLAMPVPAVRVQLALRLLERPVTRCRAHDAKACLRRRAPVQLGVKRPPWLRHGRVGQRSASAMAARKER